MGYYDETTPAEVRTMVLFFVVDTSGSMAGEKIGTVNDAIRDVIPEIQDISENNADAEIKIATLTFSTGAQWICDENGEAKPKKAEEYYWSDLNAGGTTSLGEACRQLNEKLSRNAFMNEVAGSYAPAIFLLSDGAPNDDYKSGLEKLKQNNWFKNAIKVAVAIGKEANKSVLADFTGDAESVIEVHTPQELRKWIQFIALRSSQIGSQSSPVDDYADTDNNDPDNKGRQGKMIGEIRKERGAEPNTRPDSGYIADNGVIW